MHSFSYSYTVISQMASCTTICPDQIRFHHIMNLYNQPVFSYTKAYPIYRTLLYTNRYCIRMLQILFCASEQIYKNLYLQTIEIIVMWDEKQRCITTEDWSPRHVRYGSNCTIPPPFKSIHVHISSWSVSTCSCSWNIKMFVLKPFKCCKAY